MAENPLLPHARLKELYALMKRVHSSLQSAPRAARGLEAVVAAAVVQLEPGDVFCALSGNAAQAAFPAKLQPTQAALASENLAAAVANANLPDLSSLISLGMKAAARKNAAISITSSEATVDWADTLATAQTNRAPFVPIIVDTNTLSAAQFSWSALTKIAKKAAIPTISVDGQDAVAMYRVVQECLHRAKQGDGPAVIWCSFTEPIRRGTSSPAITTMERYLAVRGLLKSR